MNSLRKASSSRHTSPELETPPASAPKMGDSAAKMVEGAESEESSNAEGIDVPYR